MDKIERAMVQDRIQELKQENTDLRVELVDLQDENKGLRQELHDRQDA